MLYSVINFIIQLISEGSHGSDKAREANNNELMKGIETANELSTQMIRGLEDVNRNIALLREEVKAMKKNQEQTTQLITDDSNCPTLPLNSTEDIELTEEVLKEQGEWKIFLKRLSSVGGNNVRIITNNIMNKVIYSEMTLNYRLNSMVIK